MRFSKILPFVAALLMLAIPSGAQNLLRHNYKYNGYTRVRTERVWIANGKSDSHPFWMSLEYVLFPDGKSDAWIIELDFEEASSVNIPKGVNLGITLSDNKVVISKQMEAPSGDKRAFVNSSDKRVYWNVGKYLYETADFNRLLSGVKSIDVATGWNPDSYIQKSFPNDEFSASLRKLAETVKKAGKPSGELVDNVARYADNNSSKTVVSKTLQVEGASLVSGVNVNYIYYKSSNKEDYDLSIRLNDDAKRLLGYDVPVTFTFADGSILELKQQRDTYNEVILYPTADQLKKLFSGVRKMSIATEAGNYTETFAGDAFSSVIESIYNSLQTVAVL